MVVVAGIQSLTFIDLLVPALFVAALVALGFFKYKRKTSGEEYLIMARSLSAPAFVMSLVTSWYGGILGVSEYSYRFGLSNWFVFGLPYYLYAAIFAVFLARRARRSRLISIPDRLHQAYGNGAARIGAAVIFFVTMPAAYLLMLGKLTSWMFGWSYPVALLAGVIFSTIYIYSGGLRSIVRTDLLQFVVMYGGFAMLVVFLYQEYGGIAFLRENVSPELFTPTGGQAFTAVLVWYFIAATTLIEPVFYERVYASKSERQVLPGILIAIGFWAIFDFMTTATGLYARAVLGTISDPTFAFPELASRVLPAGLFGLFLAALLATIMSTIDSYSFVAAGALGRDLFRKPADQDSPKRIRIALGVTTVCAALLALTSESIVSLWHALGSIAAPVLLIPTLAAWSDRYRFNRQMVIPAMIVAGSAALIWRLSPNWNAGVYWLTIEPIYVGLGISLLLYVVGRMRGV